MYTNNLMRDVSRVIRNPKRLTGDTKRSHIASLVERYGVPVLPTTADLRTVLLLSFGASLTPPTLIGRWRKVYKVPPFLAFFQDDKDTNAPRVGSVIHADIPRTGYVTDTLYASVLHEFGHHVRNTSDELLAWEWAEQNALQWTPNMATGRRLALKSHGIEVI